ncbi:MAG: DUF262 domain-containing protein [Oscillatoriales cyanobacterium SM2_1_8]|nr:DUF262 domain-containing protein [Oscillatoriales cyanobacterium SM2_1_8]
MAHLLDTRTTSFGDLVGNGKIYRVPSFQRDYSWKPENWEDLWQDILELNANPNASHYMGAIVLQTSRSSEKAFTIIDGQQRLITLSILAIAVINQIKKLADQGQETEANQERQEILKRAYISHKDPRSLRYSSKIILNEANDDFYQSNLINLRPPRNIRSLSKSNQLLWQAFEYFAAGLQELKNVVQGGDKLTEFLTDSIAQRLIFIQINVEDELNAYTVFETLNARGIELSSTDLLKNYIFSLFRGPDDLQEAQRQWRRIINAVQMEKFPDFLRYYLNTKQSKIRKERLFKIIRDSVEDGRQAFEVLDQLEELGSLFVALGNPNDVFWQDYPESRTYICELELFRVKQAYPTLFIAYQRFSPEDFTRLLKLVSVLSFRYIVVGGLNPNEMEALYSKAAMAIAREDIKSPRQVFDGLRPVYVSDEKFRQDFSLLSVPTKGQKKKLASYILAKLESDAAGVEVSEDSFSIEHILPESPNEDWRQNLTETQIEDMVYRLGNLTPLEPHLNRDLGNKSYSTKQEVYQKSKYALTRNLLAEEWTPDTLAARQRRLADRAVHIWKSDFS